MGANENDESGLLTALKLRIVNLTGIKLVVLSGCDTGLGEIKNWQGVYGLKRALILAGSQTQMINLQQSLWQNITNYLNLENHVVVL